MTVCGKQGPKHKEYHLHGYKGGSPRVWMPAYRAQGNSLLGVNKFPETVMKIALRFLGSQ